MYIYKKHAKFTKLLRNKLSAYIERGKSPRTSHQLIFHLQSVNAVSQQESVLKLLDEEHAPSTADSLWSPNTLPARNLVVRRER